MMNHLTSKASRTIEDIVTYYNTQPDLIYPFAIQVRKKDIEDNFSRDLFLGNVKPTVLVNILLANKCHENVLWSNKTFSIDFQEVGSLQSDKKKPNLVTIDKMSDNAKVTFVLHGNGFLINNTKDRNLRLLTAKNTGKLSLAWEELDNKDMKSFIWQLVASESKSDFPFFRIEHAADTQKRPRILAKKGMRDVMTVFISTNNADGYNNEDCNVWKVLEA